MAKEISSVSDLDSLFAAATKAARAPAETLASKKAEVALLAKAKKDAVGSLKEQFGKEPAEKNVRIEEAYALKEWVDGGLSSTKERPSSAYTNAARPFEELWKKYQAHTEKLREARPPTKDAKKDELTAWQESQRAFDAMLYGNEKVTTIISNFWRAMREEGVRVFGVAETLHRTDDEKASTESRVAKDVLEKYPKLDVKIEVRPDSYEATKDKVVSVLRETFSQRYLFPRPNGDREIESLEELRSRQKNAPDSDYNAQGMYVTNGVRQQNINKTNGHIANEFFKRDTNATNTVAIAAITDRAMQRIEEYLQKQVFDDGDHSRQQELMEYALQYLTKGHAIAPKNEHQIQITKEILRARALADVLTPQGTNNNPRKDAYHLRSLWEYVGSRGNASPEVFEARIQIWNDRIIDAFSATMKKDPTFIHEMQAVNDYAKRQRTISEEKTKKECGGYVASDMYATPDIQVVLKQQFGRETTEGIAYKEGEREEAVKNYKTMEALIKANKETVKAENVHIVVTVDDALDAFHEMQAQALDVVRNLDTVTKAKEENAEQFRQTVQSLEKREKETRELRGQLDDARKALAEKTAELSGKANELKIERGANTRKKNTLHDRLAELRAANGMTQGSKREALYNAIQAELE